MTYAYIRVSTNRQDPVRQLHSIRSYAPDIPDENVFIDYSTGEDFNRPEYIRLWNTIQPGDEVIVKELDRFGRNKEQIKAEMKRFEDFGVCLRIMDMPITMDDNVRNSLLREMQVNLLIEVLSSFAQQEREKIKTRQREGIEAMPVVNGKRVSTKPGKEGRTFGPEPMEIPNFKDYYDRRLKGEITATQCCKELGISRKTWYRKCAEEAGVYAKS